MSCVRIRAICCSQCSKRCRGWLPQEHGLELRGPPLGFVWHAGIGSCLMLVCVRICLFHCLCASRSFSTAIQPAGTWYVFIQPRFHTVYLGYKEMRPQRGSASPPLRLVPQALGPNRINPRTLISKAALLFHAEFISTIKQPY